METIVLGITSGIAAFKVVDLVKKLKKNYLVEVIMTSSATKMISPKEIEKITRRKVHTHLFSKDFNYKKILKQRKVDHIQIADTASLFVIVPATANVIAKIAHGIADDFLSTTLLATNAPVLFCPSMNSNMWKKKITQDNILSLKKRNCYFFDPASGSLACGYEGKGRLPPINCIEEEVHNLLQKRTQLKGKKVVVTCGGTEEDIDTVRVLSNRSSGKMGIALAEECRKRGADVTIIRTRTSIEPSIHLKEISVRTSSDMEKAIATTIKGKDIFFQAAAIGDFLPQKNNSKMSSSKKTSITLKPRTKIIDSIKKTNKNIFLVGFKAETKNLKKKSLELLERSKADMIVANDITTLGSDTSEVTLYSDKKSLKIKRASKQIIAQKIVDEVVQRL